MGWDNDQLSLIILNAAQSGYSGFFVYSPFPGPGNLIGSWAAVAGVDPYGNAYPAGLDVDTAQITAQFITAAAETLNPGPLLEYGNTNLNIVILTGSGNWTAPAGVVSPITRFAIGAGGGAPANVAVVSGGGGGGSAQDSAPVTAGNNYAYVVGQGAAGAAGGNTTMASDSQTITARGGAASSPAGPGNGGASSAGGYAGGNGGSALFNTGGGGGGGAAGTSGGGSNGASSSGATGGNGGNGGPGFATGGAGGKGGNNGLTGVAGTAPGGGAGGSGNAANVAVAGANGTLILTYTTTGGTAGLINSIAVAPGTDPNTGDAYVGGIANYNPAFGSDIQLYQGQLRVATLTGSSSVQFSNSLLHLIEQPPDGNSYSLERLDQQATGQTVNSLSFTPVLGWSFPMAVGKYHLKGQLIAQPNVAGGAVLLEFTGSGGLAVSAMGVDVLEFVMASPVTLGNSGRLVALSTQFTGAAFGGGLGLRQVQIDGWLTVSTAGTLVPQVATNVAAGDTWTIDTPDSYLELSPL